MTNEERIIDYYSNLCKVLNQNGFKVKGNLGNKQYELDYKVDYVQPRLTMMQITRNIDAYIFLEQHGFIRKDICQFCGEKLVSNSYTFTEPINKVKLHICHKCHPEGKIYGKKGNAGCLILMFLPILIPVALILIFVLFKS